MNPFDVGKNINVFSYCWPWATLHCRQGGRCQLRGHSIPICRLLASSISKIFADLFSVWVNIDTFPQCFPFQRFPMAAPNTVTVSVVSLVGSDMGWRGWLCWHLSLENIYAMFYVWGFLGVEIILTPEDRLYGKFHLTAYSLTGR